MVVRRRLLEGKPTMSSASSSSSMLSLIGERQSPPADDEMVDEHSSSFIEADAADGVGDACRCRWTPASSMNDEREIMAAEIILSADLMNISKEDNDQCSNAKLILCDRQYEQ